MQLIISKDAVDGFCRNQTEIAQARYRALQRIGMRFKDQDDQRTFVDLPEGWSATTSHGQSPAFDDTSYDIFDQRGVKRGSFRHYVGDCVLNSSKFFRILERFEVHPTFVSLDDSILDWLKASNPKRNFSISLVACDILDNKLGQRTRLPKRWLSVSDTGGFWWKLVGKKIHRYGTVFLNRNYPGWQEIDAHWES
jgi:hypothetical protein